jgi:hypothetical protein
MQAEGGVARTMPMMAVPVPGGRRHSHADYERDAQEAAGGGPYEMLHDSLQCRKRWLCRSLPSNPTFRTSADTRPPGKPGRVFIFFSNRLGCLGSLIISAVITLILIVLFHH